MELCPKYYGVHSLYMVIRCTINKNKQKVKDKDLNKHHTWNIHLYDVMIFMLQFDRNKCDVQSFSAFTKY